MTLHVLSTLALLLSVHARGLSVRRVPFVWDGAFYRDLATSGYPATVPVVHGQVGVSGLAFFPLYPALLAVVHLFTRLPSWACSYLLGTLLVGGAGAAVAWCLKPWIGRTAATATALLWVLGPMSFILSMAYSEALFTLLLALTLGSWHRGRAAQAALFLGLAGLTRPTAIAVGLGLTVTALLLHDRSRRVSLVPLASAMVGEGAFQVYLWVHTGRIDAWSETESQGFRVHFDFGMDSVSRLASAVAHPAGNIARLGVLTLVVCYLIATGLLIGTRGQQVQPGDRGRRRWEVVVVCLALVALGIGSRNALSSLPRFLLPAFPALIPVALGLGKIRQSLRRLAIVVTGLGMMAVASGLGVYFLTFSSTAP